MTLHVVSSVGDNRDVELSYTEVTSNTTVTATAEATPQTVISANPITFDGATRVCLEFYVAVVSSAGTAQVAVNLWDDTTTDLGRLWIEGAGSSIASQGGIFARRFFTPAAATKTYRVRAWRTTADVTMSAASPYLPMYLRITVADTA